MPYFTSVTRSGVRVSLQEGDSSVAIGGVSVSLPAEAGAGIDVVAADVGADIWAVCIGVNNDRGYLLKRNDQSVTVLGDGKVNGRYAVWVTESGDVSWVPADDRYGVKHLDGTRSESRDTHHPLSPNELLIDDWGPVRVVQTFRSDQWTVGEDVSAPNGHTRIYARSGAGAPLFVWSGFAPLPAHLCAHPDGSCTVAIQIPKGEFVPVFVHSSEFEDVAPDPQPEPEPEPEPEPMPDPNLDHLLRDRTELVKQIRRDLFGISDDTPLNDARKVFQMAKRLASTLKQEGWGIVKAKPGSDNNVDGYTADIIALKDGEHVDIATSTETDGFASWQPARHKDGWKQSWNDAIAPRWEAAPDPNGNGGGEPPTPPPPNPGTHRYEGGGNDTGICDVCGLDRHDAIHAIPASKVAHVYDGGESDTGLCDICQKPKGDGIHQGVTPPPPQPPPPTGDLGELVKLVTDVVNAVEINRLELANTKALVEGVQKTLEFVLDELKRLGAGGGSGAPTAFHGTGQARLIGAFPIDLVAGVRPTS